MVDGWSGEAAPERLPHPFEPVQAQEPAVPERATRSLQPQGLGVRHEGRHSTAGRPIDAAPRGGTLRSLMTEPSEVRRFTDSGIEVRPIYAPEDLQGFDPEGELGLPGRPPFP